MTPNEYKLKHFKALKDFLSTEAGKELIPTVHQLRPLFVTNGNPHVHTESAGAVRGFENCEKAIIFLSTQHVEREEVEMTYGVTEKK